MIERDEKKAEYSKEANSKPEHPSHTSDEVKRRRRQLAFKLLLIAKGQLIETPDDIIH